MNEKPKRPVGRPPLPKSQHRALRIWASVTLKEHRKYMTEARRNKISLGAWFKRALEDSTME